MAWVTIRQGRIAHFVAAGGQFAICGRVGKKAVRCSEPAPDGAEHCPYCEREISARYGSEAGEREMTRRFYEGESTAWADFDPTPYRTEVTA